MDIIVLKFLTVWAKLQGSHSAPNVLMKQASSLLDGPCLERAIRDWLSLQHVIWILKRILMWIFLGSIITKSTMISFVCEVELDLWSMFLDSLCYGSLSFNHRQLRELCSQRRLLLHLVAKISFPSLTWLTKWELLWVWHSLRTQRCICASIKTIRVRFSWLRHFLLNSPQQVNIMR